MEDVVILGYTIQDIVKMDRFLKTHRLSVEDLEHVHSVRFTRYDNDLVNTHVEPRTIIDKHRQDNEGFIY